MESIIYHLSKLQNKLERLFDEDPLSKEEAAQIQKTFQLQTSDSYLKALGEELPQDEPDRTAVLFSRLMHLFEFGLLLISRPQPVRILALFDHGILKTMKPSLQACSTQAFSGAVPNLDSLPFFEFLSPKSELLRNTISPFFPTMRSDDRLLIIRISTHSAVVLSTTLAEPWLGTHLENVHKALRS